MAPVGARADGGDDEVGAHPVGDERLGAAQGPAALDPGGARVDRSDVGARIGLGDPQRRDLLPLDARHQVPLLLLLGAELPDRRQRDRRVRSDPGRQPPGAAARQLLGEHRVGHVAPALAAVSLLKLEAQVAELRQPVEHLVGEPSRLLPLGRPGPQLGLNEPPHRGSELLVLLGERRHRAPRRGAGQAPTLESRRPNEISRRKASLKRFVISLTCR